MGALGDFLAAMVNPNTAGWLLSPMATEMELQVVRWIASLLGYPETAGGLLVSGGNMANFVGFWTARRAKLPWNVREEGVRDGSGRVPRVYGSSETHTWIQKAADLGGLGTSAVRWIPSDSAGRIDMIALRNRILEDREAGDLPFLVVGSAGTVGTGAVDPLGRMADLCEELDLWFHVDGAYGAPAAMLPEAPPDLRLLARADSVAVDPHKWLYAPLEAGCILLREPHHLRDTFAYRPPYYPDHDRDPENTPTMFYELGPQNSRGFRALKVWLQIRQAGREGFVRMIRDDIRLARALHEEAQAHPELEAFTQGLSITTFRFRPSDLPGEGEKVESYLSTLNKALMERIQETGQAFLSNAVVEGRFVLRACVVNFRTDLADIASLPPLVVETGHALDRELRPPELRR
jgi:glutamate/tyrosine decarboxylase-like PLP-dependent enzyme